MKLKKRKRSKNGTVLYVNGKMVHVRCLSIAQRTSCEMNINITFSSLLKYKSKNMIFGRRKILTNIIAILLWAV